MQLGAAPFSNPGASLLVSAPGSNVVSTSHMLKTDRGSTFGSQYSDMHGTSFATPIASGVAALMLQANPNLGYRDVQEILALSAKRVGDQATQWRDNGSRNWNGGGMHASHDYGFGAIDARAAVRLAESWAKQSTGANERVYTGKSGVLGQTLTAGSTYRSTLSMPPGLAVRHAEIDFDADVGRLGDLVVKLVSPDGTESILLDRPGKAPAGAPRASDADMGNAFAGRFKYTFMSTHAWGERSDGNWTLEVTDATNDMPVKLNQWSLRLYGSLETADDTYFYTNEYGNQIVANPGRAFLEDSVNGSPGGRNTLNAAAVSGNTLVDLTTGEAIIGGVSLTIRQPDTIHNIVSGDGDDWLVAGSNDALLDGGRGKNVLDGGFGKDFFVVHRRANGLDTIENFDAARGEIIDLVGFAGKAFGDLVLTQNGADVDVDLGNGQRIVVKGQHAAALTAGHFLFQDSFIAPAHYFDSAADGERLPDAGGIVILNGGANGVSYTSDADGRLIASLSGTIYSHDAATSDTFVIAKQDGVSSYRNALRGFKHGIDKIDLSQTGITSFGDLVIDKRNRATINGLSQIHGVSVGARSLSAAGTTVELVYLDALDLAQVTESDFIFAKQVPPLAGVATTPPAYGDADPAPIVQPQPVTVEPVKPIEISPVEPVSPVRPVESIGVPPIERIKVPAVEPINVPPAGISPFERINIPPLVSPFEPINRPPARISPISLIDIPSLEILPIERTNTPPAGISPIKLPAIPGFGRATLSGHAPSYRMIDATRAWNSDPLARLFSVPQGDTLTYAATLADGSPLPAWLSYDTVQSRLSGTPGESAIGVINVKVTATNQNGVTADSMLELQIQTDVLDVPVFEKIEVPETQAAINQSEAFSSITATGGTHVLLQSGSGVSATLQGDGANRITVAGANGSLTVGDGNNAIKLVGSNATVVGGNGANVVESTDDSATVSLGNGDNTVTGAFRSLTVGNGNNMVMSTTSIATLTLGDGHDVATIRGAISTVNVGHGHYDLDFSGSLGKLRFSSDVAVDDLWFRRVDQDLDISVIDCTETVKLKDWYASAPHRAGNIMSGDGKTLSSFNVEKLVQAMAAFSPPAAGTTYLTPEQQNALQPVFAANWH